MLTRIIKFSLDHKLIILIGAGFLIVFGLFSLSRVSIGAVPDITNNQVQVITTSRNLSTQDMEQFITYPIEMEMANLPGVEEIRSISKFGLSVVTIVFQDQMGTWLPRQLIAEKLRSATANIPERFGKPEMGPITTGLGEIYQYVLDVDPAFKDRYSAMDLRTIQDWIVKRQLSGIPGVVEVNTWGGYLKQYEVALIPTQLSALNITVSDVVSALENNNSIAGGGYIEKSDQAYFIRGEGLIQDMTDLENIVINTGAENPVYLKDIAEARFGYATRFGAITGNGEGEKVLGQVMMLKDANSKKVIDAVKARVATISKTLPEGVRINAFLDRSELISKTTNTVRENLLLGCLIVVFVVVLLLGNLRSGLVIASVIPLSLLFALSMMYLFEIDANLMSLGAIDFGIIIDGAVIIVEFIAFKLTAHSSDGGDSSVSNGQKLRDRLTLQGASEMMNSAVFGQLIILIVFIPILSLSDIEGKMFQPMALTFCFALIGAMLLCFTYVPVMSSMLLRTTSARFKLSAQFLRSIQNCYTPAISMALKFKRLSLSLSIVMIILAAVLFSRLGAEFVPTLDEGDFVIQPVLKTGTSLSKTIAITTRIEQTLLNEFPEVDQVITRIGAAEVPTDPMSMEDSDVIITLKEKSQWVSANSKDELAAMMKEALTMIPGIEVEFTQPIEMRFNELISGVRSDIAIKVYGENLETLAKLGEKIKQLSAEVPGAADINVERTEGLPQMHIEFNRSKIARYGLDITELNNIIAMSFAGYTVGNIFEGEKKFDLVLRLKQEYRQDISDLETLYIDLSSGEKVPLGELATITYKKGVARISRDNTRRRVVVGVNVRQRDLQSVVSDIRRLIDNNLDLPVGYTVEYGGQFENLQKARSRLRVAIPVALSLIFMMLFFAFRSLKKAFLIFTAIPLSAVGGIILLYLREMPFSISAGVGFIALFGIAVLNGIVLLEHFRSMDLNEFDSVEELVIQGAKDRLRAVLLTAMAAALGFLPMAISSNVGAEVQRPLATVVIGGLVTATLLTLIVLPVLYTMIYGKTSGLKLKARPAHIVIAGILFFNPSFGDLGAQELGLEELRKMALQNNPKLLAASLETKRMKTLKGNAWDFEKTEVYYQYDQNNLAINGSPLEVWGVQQNFLFPTVYTSRQKINSVRAEQSNISYQLQKIRLFKELEREYLNYQTAIEKKVLYHRLDSLYRLFSRAAEKRFELGETNYLEKITARSREQQVNLLLKRTLSEVEISYRKILSLIQGRDTIKLRKEVPVKMTLPLPEYTYSLESQLLDSEMRLGQAETALSKNQLWPDISLEYFRGSNELLDGSLYGYQIGLKFPILFNGNLAEIKAAGINTDKLQHEKRAMEIVLSTKKRGLETQLENISHALDYYELEGRELYGELERTAIFSFKNGEIDFFQYIQSIENAYRFRLDHLEQLNEYNNIVIQLKYLTTEEEP